MAKAHIAPSIQDIFRHIFSQPLDGRNLIFGHKLHIGIPYRGKRFWPHQIPSIVALKNVHICSMCIKINKVGKQEVGI
jgi:hypothetical protein